MKISRVEAITDGIVAIAATIMVLQLGIPSRNDWAGLLEIKNTFLAYVISFFMIYLAWSLHHNLFKKAEHMSRRSFIVNGIWILFLTLAPFTTSWVGAAPDATVPEFLYALNMLLWSAAFQWLEYLMHKDNPDIEWGKLTRRRFRIIMYVVLIICIILAFIKPQFCMYLIGLTTLFSLVWSIVKRRKSAAQH